MVHCDKYDKYGRLLAKVNELGDEVNLNQQLILLKMARVYDGGRKVGWREDELDAGIELAIKEGIKDE